jgi:catechol 2,3-dioxygenase-like lactoylglutathione lyase family enzyme
VIDHVGLGVSDLEQSKAFYQQALFPLGYQLLLERDGSDQATVQAFHAAGLAAGGRDNGPPGLRPQYHQNYYGAFILDPDGNNIEAVCHRPA